jgi:hypothetical protein
VTAEDAARAFTDLRVISALLCRSWPLSQDLMDSRLTAAVSEHVRRLGAGYHQSPDRQPHGILANRRPADRSRRSQGQRRPGRHPGPPRPARQVAQPQPDLGTDPRPAPVHMLPSPARGSPATCHKRIYGLQTEAETHLNRRS